MFGPVRLTSHSFGTSTLSKGWSRWVSIFKQEALLGWSPSLVTRSYVRFASSCYVLIVMPGVPPLRTRVRSLRSLRVRWMFTPQCLGIHVREVVWASFPLCLHSFFTAAVPFCAFLRRTRSTMACAKYR